jgi:lambda repressor-like predicted transcriptional regulator
MSDKQRTDLIRRARRLAMARDLSLNQTAAHLSRRTGRALETLRQMLLQHDARNPHEAIFTDRSGPLSPRQQEVIARAHKRGVSVRRLSQRFNKTHSTIYRAIRQRRASELRKLEITFVPAPTFSRDDADQVILRPVRMTPVPCELHTQGLSEALASLYARPGLAPAAAQRLLTQLNYLKYKAVKLRDALDRYEPAVAQMNQLDSFMNEITRRRNELVHAHLHLVLAAAQRQTISSPQGGPAALAHLLELGNQVLFDAIAQFDPGKDQTFGRFVTYRLQKRFAQVELDAARAHRKFDAQQIIDRLVEQAQQSGVNLLL